MAVSSTVSAIATVETDRFTDSTLTGRNANEFRDKWIRFVTPANPAGIVTRVRTFNPATGEFTLHDPIPAGAVAAGDVYWVADTPWRTGASGTSQYLMASSEPGCQPAGTAGPDVIVCTGADTTGVVSEDGSDDIVVTDGASVTVDRLIPFSQVRITDSATGIDAGAGHDSVLNAGEITADTDGVLVPLLTPPGLDLPGPLPGTELIWNALIKVDLDSKGIVGGSEHDELTNTGTVTARSTAVILPSSFPTPIPGLSSADISSTADARSTGIEGGDGHDSLTNSGTVSADSTASAVGVSVAIVSGGEDAGEAEVRGDVKAAAAATGLSAGDGHDTVTNSGAIEATSSATSAAVTAGVLTVQGSAGVSAKAEAEATSVGVTLGDGNDALTNHGTVATDAVADAQALNIGVATPTSSSSPAKLKSAVSGGADATARATGINADARDASTSIAAQIATDGTVISIDGLQLIQARPSGHDEVTNTGSVSATATASTGVAGVVVTVDGATTAEVTSKANAEAIAVDLGGGHDEITNSGQLTAASDATAHALNLALGLRDGSSNTTERTSAAEGSAEAESHAIGLAADSGAQDVTRSIALTIEDDRELTQEEAAIVNGGVIANRADDRMLTLQQSKTYASGNDTVVNSGTIEAIATASSAALGVGITIDAQANAKTTSTAKAIAAGVDLGGGNDTLGNTGHITSTADALAAGLNVAVGISNDSSPKTKSGSGADGSATAESNAVGLSADSSAADVVQTIELGITDFEDDSAGAPEEDCRSCIRLGVSYSKTETRASGQDTVTNSGTVESHATASATAGGVGVTVEGAASSSSKSTSEAAATAIDLGGGADTLTNTGTLVADADSTAQALSVAVSTKGGATTSDGFWQGGVKTEATAIGIDADGQGQKSMEVDVTLWNDLFVRYRTRTDATFENGADTITNRGNITADAFARTLSANVSITAEGKAAALSNVLAEADAAGIRAGQGDDSIDNLGTGQMVVNAEARGGAASVTASGKGVALAADALWNSGIKAEATAIGIDGDGKVAETTLVTARVASDGAELVYETAKSSVEADDLEGNADDEHAASVGSGNDTIVNEQTVDVQATSTSSSLGVAVVAEKGVAAAVSSVSSEAESTGIRGGHGDDDITNRGAVTSEADATAEALSIVISPGTGAAVATNSVWDGGTTAEATAVGIDADGGHQSEIDHITLTVDGSGARIVRTKTERAASGDDTIVNNGQVEAEATATSLQTAVTVATKGLSAAVSQATTKATATAIRGGDGIDDITNTGWLTSTTLSSAEATNVAITFEKGGAIAGNAVWDGGVTAEATSIGIQGDGGDLESVSTLTLRTSGGDLIDRAFTATVARGDDIIKNSGQIDAFAEAFAPAISVAFSTQGVAAAVSTATAGSNAVGIDAGDGNDTIRNRGAITADARSSAVAINGSVVNQGAAIAANDSWDGGVNADARVRGIDGAAGFDRITNDDSVVAHSRAAAGSVAVAIAVTGVPIAVSTSTATSDAAAIDAGGGTEADEIVNKAGGTLSAHAEAEAFAANVAVSNNGLAIAADAVWDGGTKADAAARGIDAGLGADTVKNDGAISATADAAVKSLAVSAVVNGVAGATTSATATSFAAAIDSGAGNDADDVSNTGHLTATSNADATSVAISLTGSGAAVTLGAVWDGGTTSDATARGIATGGGVDRVRNEGAIDATADAWTGSLAASGAASGIAAAIATSTARANATAIDTGDDAHADRIVNAAKLVSTSNATAGTVTVAVTSSGVTAAGDAAWNGGTTGEAFARGIFAGNGGDEIRNDGDIEAWSDAETLSANVSVAISGVAGAVGTATATSSSTAIDGGDGDDAIRNFSAGLAGRTGWLIADAESLATATTVTVTTAGVAVSADAVWDGGTTAEATARGIDGAGGADLIANETTVEAHADAITDSNAVGIAITGVAGAIASSTGRTTATAIDAGDSDHADTVRNTGALTADADTNAVAVGIGFTTAGLSVAGNATWDGGTTAEALARGIAAGQGSDRIVNAGTISATSDADADAITASVAVYGVAGAISTATADARSTAIDGGAGEDVIRNEATGALTSTARATGVAVNVAVAGIGVAGALDSVWDGGTKADATARGIDGGDGVDRITNDATIDASADSTTASVAAAVTGIGAGGAISTSTSTANATAIDGGDAADTIDNHGNLTSTSTANATGVQVTVTGVGAAASADAFWDGGTKANAHATGVAGGAGGDTIDNTAETVTADATATSHSVAIAATGIGLSAAAAASTATAQSTGFDGGEGADGIDHGGVLVSNATASADGTTVTVTVSGAAISGAFLDNLTKAESIAVGIAGGTGNDTIETTGGSSIALTSDAETTAKAVSVSVSPVGSASFAASDTQALAIARATGMDGGDGEDTLENQGDITGTITADAKGRGVSVALGATQNKSNASAEANATGMDGGNDADVITNAAGATIDIDATAVSNANGVTVSILDSTSAEAQTTPTADVVGLQGGAGDDDVFNDGTIALLATSTSSSSNSSTSIFGSAGGVMGSVAHAETTGLSGGEGNDRVRNRFSVAVESTSTSSVSGSSWSLVGAPSSESALESTSLGTGMAGGGGLDWIRNEDDVVVTVGSTLTATGGSDAIFGGASDDTQLTALTQGFGLAGGDGADTIANANFIDVRSTSTVTSTKATVSFAGSPASEALLVSNAQATGIDGGADGDSIGNTGVIAVTAESLSDVIGGASAQAAGSAGASGWGTIEALARGIHAGDGADTITNGGVIDVSARGDSLVRNDSSSGLLFSNANTFSDARATLESAGLSGGDGDNVMTNNDELVVETNGTGYAFSYASGAHLSIGSGNGRAESDARANSFATGMLAGDGSNLVVSNGNISVSAIASTVKTITASTTTCERETVQTCTVDPDTGEETCVEEIVNVCREEEGVLLQSHPTYAGANGNGATGDGTAVADATANAQAHGIRAGDGSNTIINNLDIGVTGEADARATTFADGDLGGNATGTATTTATVLAAGIRTGDGNSEIRNSGSITALAQPTAQARTEVTGGDICIFYLFGTWCGSGGTGTGTSTSTLNGQAVGVLTGDGDNVIVNDGTISVSAAPQATGGFTALVTDSADTAHVATNVTSRAIGIQTGGGNNQILNGSAGTIEAMAQDVSVCNGCATTTLEAVGIQTGAGNDLIVNEGMILTSIDPRSGPVAAGVAINAAAGNDIVVLGSGSSTTGAVQLGTGSDMLVWSGNAALTGIATAGTEATDTFALGGEVDADFNHSQLGTTFQQFDLFHKQGTSTWTLFGNRQIDWTVDGGTLAVHDAITGTIDTSFGSVNAEILVLPDATIRRADDLPAVELNGDGTLTNLGLVETTSGSGVGVAVLMAGNEATVVNEGTIQGGSIGAGVVLAGHDDTLINRGLVTGGSAVVFASTPGSVEHVVNETGGLIESTSGIAIQGGLGDDHVDNHGLLAGGSGVAIDLGQGNDQLLISARSAFDGTSRGAGGFDTFVLGGSENAAFDMLNIGTEFEGFELYRKQGSSTWTLFGASVMDWVVDQGTLEVSGDIHGTVGTNPRAVDATIDVLSNGSVRRNDGLAAIALAGGATLTNNGLIETTGGGIAVQALGSGNLVTNRGEIVSGGLGVQVIGNGNVLNNAGDIQSAGVGIEVDGGGNVVVNTGSVAGRVGARLKGSSAALVNHGDILATQTGVAMEADGGSIANVGLVAAEGVGIAASGDGVTIVNQGSVRSTNAGGVGIAVSGEDVSLTNLGLISARGSAVRFDTAEGETGTIVNVAGGVIQSSGGLAVVGGDGVERFENYGNVIGGAGTAINLGDGNDELLVNTGASIAGLSIGGSGSDTLGLTGAGVAIADLSTFRDFELLRKTGAGIWVLDGSSEMAWNLAQGTLIVEGTLSGDGLVGVNSRLMGNGSVGGFVNAGTVAPGASIGTLTVLGDYEHALGATLEIEGAITGQSDRLEVTGEAVLKGGTVQALPESRPYGIATEYTILNAAGGVSGAFETVTSGLSYLDPFLDYDPTAVYLTLVRNDISFRNMGTTSNLFALSTALDANKRAMAKGDFKGVMDQFVAMDEAERAAALFSLTGELHATTSRALLRTGNRFFSASVDRRLSARAVEGERKTVWTDAFGFSGRLDGDGNAGAARYRAAGLAVGVDLMVADTTRLGAAFGFSPGSSELDTLGGGSANLHSYHPAVYGDHRLGRWELGAGAGYSRHQITTARDVRFGAVARRAVADYQADQYSGLVRSAYDLRTTTTVSLDAIGELWFSRLTRDGFTESGADSAGLTEVSDGRSDSLRSVLGLRASWTPKFWGMRMKPELQVAWAHESLDASGELTASLTGAPGAAGWAPFTIRGVTEARDSALVTLGAATDFGKSGQAFVAYDGCLAGTGAEHGFAAGMRFSW